MDARVLLLGGLGVFLISRLANASQVPVNYVSYQQYPQFANMDLSFLDDMIAPAQAPDEAPVSAYVETSPGEGIPIASSDSYVPIDEASGLPFYDAYYAGDFVSDGGKAYMITSSTGVQNLAVLEAFRADPYPDQAGYMTIGYGHKILPGETFTSLTEDEAIKLLAKDLYSAENAVNNYVKVPINQNQFDALASFVFNVGAGAFRNSTLLRLLNARDYDGAAGQFAKWCYVTKNGQKVVSNGLSTRRGIEATIFASMDGIA